MPPPRRGVEAARPTVLSSDREGEERMPDALYERDCYSWTQEQARLLHARAEL